MGSKFGWFNQANQQFQKTRIRSNGCFTSVTQKKLIFSQSAIVALTLKVNCSISCTCITLLCTLSCRNYLHGTGTSSSRTFVTVFFTNTLKNVWKINFSEWKFVSEETSEVKLRALFRRKDLWKVTRTAIIEISEENQIVVCSRSSHFKVHCWYLHQNNFFIYLIFQIFSFEIQHNVLI